MHLSNEQYQTTQKHDNQKIFTLQRAEDETTLQIIGARRQALLDDDLSDGAKVLFCLLLDLAVSRSSMHGFGAVLISVTQLTEALNRCPRAIYGWKKQLIAKRYVRITGVPMPNFWPVHVYHIAALTEGINLSQMPTKDGFWGNGARRQLPEKVGMGAREPGQKALGLRGIKGHAKVTDPNYSNLAENAMESGIKVHPSVALNATGSGTKVQRGAARNDTGEPHESAAGSRTKVQRGAARNDTGEPHKGADIIKPKIGGTRVSEGRGGSSPPDSAEEKAFKEWVRTLDGQFPSRLEKQRGRIKEQLRNRELSHTGRELLKRKLAVVTEKLDGPQPEIATAKPTPKAKSVAQQNLSDAELLESAKVAIQNGWTITERQRELLRALSPGEAGL